MNASGNDDILDDGLGRPDSFLPSPDRGAHPGLAELVRAL